MNVAKLTLYFAQLPIGQCNMNTADPLYDDEDFDDSAEIDESESPIKVVAPAQQDLRRKIEDMLEAKRMREEFGDF